MRFGFVSDLHLAPGALNRHVGDSRALERWLTQVYTGVDELVVVGDLFDLYRSRLPGGWRAQLSAIRREHGPLLEQLDRADWICGNHDWPLSRLGIPSSRAYQFEATGEEATSLSLLIEHGQRWDPWLKHVPGLPQAGNWIAGWSHRLGLESIPELMAQLPLWLDHRRHRVRVERSRGGRDPEPREGMATASGGAGLDGSARWRDPMVRGAEELSCREGWDVIVCGHSHQLRLVPLSRGLLINSGALFRGRFDLAILDVEQGCAEIWREDERRARALRQEDGRWALEQ